jgi:NO-binding membrane sensor protein with MHYT domain
MFRGRVSYPLHAALELATAIALIAVPFVIGLSVDATITAVIVGTILFGLAVSATGSEGRGTLPISAHAIYDAAVAFVLVGAAIVFGLGGEVPALVFLLVAGVAQLTLNGFTRYSPSRA